MSDQLRHIATKIQFSQNKLRNSFLPEIRLKFAAEEYIHAHTYGPSEYYILSDRRLYIATVNSTGFFVRKHELQGLKQIVELQRITRTTQWSDLFYAQFDNDARNPYMYLQVETFDGDINVTVNAFDSNEGFFGDPHYFQSMLEEVTNNIQNRQIHQHEALWRAK